MEFKEDLAKQILDEYATIVVQKEAIFKHGEYDQVNMKKKVRYEQIGYNKDIVLWIPPMDCIRVEFEDTIEKNSEYITQLEAACRAKGFDYCISYHKGAKSPYINLFNIEDIPVNEDNKIAKLHFVEKLLPSGAKRQLDRTNLGWTLSPVINHPHWKSKYGGAIHSIRIGKNPLEHKNKYPSSWLNELKKIKEKTRKSSKTAKEIAVWIEDFLLNYCCNNKLPAGQRHHVIEKNLAAYIIHRQDKEQIENNYLKAQERSVNTLRTWYAAILNNNYTEVSTGELYNYIKDNELDFDIPKPKDKETNNPFEILEQNYQKNVINFHSIKPFFYDKYKIFWFWNEKNFRYEIVDEVDLMIELDKALNFDGKTVNKSLKTNYIEAFKRVGRIKHPTVMDKNLIQFKGQSFNLKTKIFKDVNTDLLFTNPIPWDVGESSDTPTMDKLFKEWVGESYSKTLYEIIAYSCYQGYPIQLLFALCGCGRNGKSQYLKIVEKFIGKENSCATEFDLLLSNRFESFKLYKKLLCTIGETNFSVIDKSNILKGLTGGDTMSYEKKRYDGFSDYNTATTILASNSLPSSADTSDGFYRRWLIIDFPNNFEEIGYDIVDTIPEEEYNNLARKVTEILPELLKKGKFTNQGTVKERKEKYIEMSNPFTSFIQEKCVKSDNYYVSSNKLYTEYVKYLNSKKRRVVSRKEFSSVINNEGLYQEKTSKKIDGEYISARWTIGIKLKTELLEELNTDCNKSSEYENLIVRYININSENNLHNTKLMFGEDIIQRLIQKGVIMLSNENTLRAV